MLVDDVPVDKAGTAILDDAQVRVRGRGRRFVSRGGDKLAAALADLAIDPTGLACLDIGASTGGFSDCLLQAGATSVVAVDVGYGQLHEKLRRDPRVRVLERTNARELRRESIPESIDLVVVDVSFISLRLVLPAIASCAAAAHVLALVKPQFEVGRSRVGKGGVVRDDALRGEACRDVETAAGKLGYSVLSSVDSQVAGPKGNREIFLWLAPPNDPIDR